MERYVAKLSQSPMFRVAVLVVAAALLLFTGLESYSIGFASGHWIGRFSAKWALTLAAYTLAALLLIALLFFILYRPERLSKSRDAFIRMRSSIGGWAKLLVLLLALSPAYLVFFTTFGTLYSGIASRLLVFTLPLFLLTAWLSDAKENLLEFKALLLSTLFIGAALTLAESFSLVSSYPFSLHWSEGNRIWDYSVLFGRERYNFPPANEIFVFIDPGRQALWGLPFLIPNISIWWVRFWSAFLVTVPYALLGWFTFKLRKNAVWIWVILGLWTLIFLNQGPIYTPLILSAIMIAGVRKRPLWIALPIVFLAGHYAGVSRFTWRFAPAIWAVMLTIGDASGERDELKLRDWLRAGALGIAAAWTKGIPVITGIIEGLREAPSLAAALNPTATPVPPTPLPGTPFPTPMPRPSVETLEGVREAVTNQPLLWYRLLPNEVYPPGIILGLILAALPLILLILYAWRRGFWKSTAWSWLINAGSALAFLAVGLTASSKVGGGTDLHNMDMFLVTLVFLAGLAWDSGLRQRIGELLRGSAAVRALLVAIILVPAIVPALGGQPPEKLDALQAEQELARLQERVACAAQHGEVLFMDQRQLLTFGHMGDIALAPEYEKKYVMNQALADNSDFFNLFRIDLASKEYAMIVTERQSLRYKVLEEDRLGDNLIEENNAWVKWVTTPLLEYYESTWNRRGIGIELFVPIDRDFDC